MEIAPGLTREMLLRRDWTGLDGLCKTGLRKIDGLAMETEYLENISKEQVKNWQQEDNTLEEILKNCKEEGNIVNGQSGWELRNTLMYYIGKEGNEQLVVPQRLRETVLKLAHDILMVGRKRK